MRRDTGLEAAPALDLLVRGGTVVTAGGSLPADVHVRDGRIVAVAPRPPGTGLAAAGPAAMPGPGRPGTPWARDIVDADGLLVLPGAVDVHTHIRVASDAEPDRFFRDSIAAAFGGTTTFLAFNNPGTGASPAAERSVLAGLREFRAATATDSAIDFGLSVALSGRMADPVTELPAMVDAGVPTAKAFMVFDFRLDEARIVAAMAALGRLGGMLQLHCEDPALIDAAVAAALDRGRTAARYHAATRPPEAEARATARAMDFVRATGAPVHVVHLSAGAALRHVAAAKAEGLAVSAETCPHYLALTDDRYRAADQLAVAEVVISPPLRSAADQAALWDGLGRGDLDLVATDHVPDRVDQEKAAALRGVPFDRISSGAPGIETLLAIAWSRGVATGRITPERLVDLLATTPARRFGLARKGAVEVGRDADLVLFDPSVRRTIRAVELHHTSDYTPFEGLAAVGAVRSVFVRGRAVVRDGAFVGDRGYGRFVERAGAGG